MKASNLNRDWLKLLNQVQHICENMIPLLRDHQRKDVPSRIILAFLTKGTHTLKGILLLYKNGLDEEAQSLIRVVFELFVTFEVFVRQLFKDPAATCKRFLDVLMLEKCKQSRESKYQGHQLFPEGLQPKDLDAIEKKISGEYTADDFKNLRLHGFSGMNVKERAKQADVHEMYNIIYRNFSRNVHSKDFVEFLQKHSTSPFPSFPSYPEVRNRVAYEVVFISVVMIAEVTDNIFGLGFKLRLHKLQIRREELTARSSIEPKKHS